MKRFWENQRILAVGIIGGLAVIGIWCIPLLFFGFEIGHPIGDNTIDKLMSRRGTFGDMFGGVTSLFSALTVIGVAIGVALQTQELSETKNALADAREDRIEDNYESRFFQLLSLLIDSETRIQKTIYSMNPTKPDSKTLYGNKAFEYIFRDIYKPHESAVDVQYITSLTTKAFHYHEDHLYNFITTLCIIIDHTYSRNAPDLLTHLIRAQVKPNQLIAFAYLGIPDDSSVLKTAIEKSGLFAALKNETAFRDRFKEYYAPSAFGE